MVNSQRFVAPYYSPAEDLLMTLRFEVFRYQFFREKKENDLLKFQGHRESLSKETTSDQPFMIDSEKT